MGLLSNLYGKAKQFGQEALAGLQQVVSPVTKAVKQALPKLKATVKQSLPLLSPYPSEVGQPLATSATKAPFGQAATTTAKNVAKTVSQFPSTISSLSGNLLGNVGSALKNATTYQETITPQPAKPTSTADLYRLPVSTQPAQTTQPTTPTPTSSPVTEASLPPSQYRVGGSVTPSGPKIVSIRGGEGLAPTIGYEGDTPATNQPPTTAEISQFSGGGSSSGGASISRAGVTQAIPGITSGQALLSGFLPYQLTEEEKNRQKNEFIDKARAELAKQGIANPQFFGNSIENLSVFDTQGRPVLQAGELAKQLGYKPPQFQTPEAFTVAFDKTPEGAIGAEALFQTGRETAAALLSNPNAKITKEQFANTFNQYKEALKQQISQQNYIPDGALPKNETIATQLAEDPTYQKQIADYLNSLDMRMVDQVMGEYKVSDLLKQQENLRNELLAEAEAAKKLTDAIEQNPNLPARLGEKRKALIERASQTNLKALELRLSFAQQAYKDALELANQKLGVFQHLRDQEVRVREQEREHNQQTVKTLIETGSIGEYAVSDLQTLAQQTGYRLNDLTKIAKAVKDNKTQKALREQQKADLELARFEQGETRLQLSEDAARRAEQSLGFQERRLTLSEQQAGQTKKTAGERYAEEAGSALTEAEGLLQEAKSKFGVQKQIQLYYDLQKKYMNLFGPDKIKDFDEHLGRYLSSSTTQSTALPITASNKSKSTKTSSSLASPW